MKRKVIYISVIITSILILIFGNKFASSNMPTFDGISNDECYKAKVTEIIKRSSAAQNTKDVPFSQGVNIFFSAKMLSGEHKGEIVTAIQNSDPEFPSQIRDVQNGDTVLLAPNIVKDSQIGWLMREYVRTDTLIILGAVLCILVILFGKFKGVNTLLSLGFTCIAIFNILVPAILSGKNIYLWSIFVCLFIIIMTLLLVNDATKKCVCSMLGCISGVLASAIFTLISDRFLKLTGMVDEDSFYLSVMNESSKIDLKAIIFAGILIGAIGAIMDVSTSLSSALFEISEKSVDNSIISILKSGITIGKDIMGTMANTLVLAYIGGSLSTTLLLIAYSHSMLALLNREMIVVEILQALAGSFGILLTIPLTSLISALLFSNKNVSASDDK